MVCELIFIKIGGPNKKKKERSKFNLLLQLDTAEYESFAVRSVQVKVMYRRKYRHDGSTYFTRRRNIMQNHLSLRTQGSIAFLNSNMQRML